MHKVMSPTASMQAIIGSLEDMISDIHESLLPSMPVNATGYLIQCLMFILTDNVEAILSLARYHHKFYLAAEIIARACFETAATIYWIIDPEDDIQRHVRHIRYLRSVTNDYYRPIDKALDYKPENGPYLSEAMEDKIRLEKLHLITKAQMKEADKGMPNTSQLMEYLANSKTTDLNGFSVEWLIYKTLCQSVHGSFDIILKKTIPISIDRCWYNPLSSAGYSLLIANDKIFERLTQTPSIHITDNHRDMFLSKIGDL